MNNWESTIENWELLNTTIENQQLRIGIVKYNNWELRIKNQQLRIENQQLRIGNWESTIENWNC